MSTRKIALGFAALSMVMYGCDGSDGTPDPEGTLFPARDLVCEDGAVQPCETNTPVLSEDDRRVEEEGGAAMTYTYVVRAIQLPEADDGMAAGFNLDDLDSGEGSGADDANCEELNEDFRSSTDPDHVGVDNALQGLVSIIEGFLSADDCPGGQVAGCIDALLQEQVNEGSVLLLMEVTDVNNLEYDSDIQLQLFLGSLPAGSGTACTTDADCTTSGERCIDDACENAPVLEGELLAAGQTFQTEMELGAPVDGDIFEGRVRARANLITIMIDAGDIMLPLMISNPEVRFDIAADGLANGAIGGFVQNADIIAAAREIAPDQEETIAEVVEMFADVNPGTDPLFCTALSVGIQFDATTATRTP